MILKSLAVLTIAILPSLAHAQSAPAFQDNYADVNGVRLHYASVGKGPLVLFLHGFPSFWYQWKDQMLEMSRDRLAVGLDMRGYNLSSKPEGLEPYKMTHLVEDVRQFAGKRKSRPRFASKITFSSTTAFSLRARNRSTRSIPEKAPPGAHSGFVDAEVKNGHYTEEDRQRWIDAWSHQLPQSSV